MSGIPQSIKDEIRRMQYHVASVGTEKRDRLKTMDFFCLDNSLRESTVGQLRSHTLENKIAIFEEIKKAGMTDIIVASFAHMTRVDDKFCEWLLKQPEGKDLSRFFSFSEVSEGVKDGRHDTETVPVSMRKNQKYGIYNTFFEFDLTTPEVDWDGKFTVHDMCQLILKWIRWVKTNIKNGEKARILINFRDLPVAMTECPERVLTVVQFLSRLAPADRMFGLAFEDPFGEYLPEELEAWTASMRRTMDYNGWSDGKLIVHIHQKWDLQTASQLDCLSAGADGVWASLCQEGAALGHADSTVTMMNLIRMGNEKLLKKYNCKYLRTAAYNITKLTTGKPPHPKQPIYGARAVDLVFGFLGIGDFDVAEFFGVEAPNRITSLATPEMIRDRLVNLFGKDPQFNLKLAGKMKELILGDLHAGRKEEYMSKVGIALLFDRAGGSLTEAMSDAIQKMKLSSPHHDKIIKEIREEWDEWDARDIKKGDDRIQFNNFYAGFMIPYFGCYSCADTKKAFKAIDMDSDGYVDWKEFLVYIKWALHEYPDTANAEEALKIAFEKGIIPAMRDEKLKHREVSKSTAFRFKKPHMQEAVPGTLEVEISY